MEKPESKLCKTCGKAEEEKYRPFCSARCAQIDLGKWLNGSFVVPGKDEPDEEENEGAF